MRDLKTVIKDNATLPTPGTIFVRGRTSNSTTLLPASQEERNSNRTKRGWTRVKPVEQPHDMSWTSLSETSKKV